MSLMTDRDAVRSITLPAPDEIRISVSLRVTGDDLDPADVTRALSRTPTAAARSGGLLRGRLVAETGTWFGFLSSCGEPEGIARPDGSAWSSVAAAALRDVPGVERLEVSILLNGREADVMAYAAGHLGVLADGLSREAECAEVDLDIPTAGIAVLLGLGERLDRHALATRLGLPASPVS